VPLFDVDGTATGTAVVTGPLAVLAAISETIGGASSADTSAPISHVIVQTLTGFATVSADSQELFNVSGFVVGSGALIDGTLLDAAAVSFGSGVVSGNAVRIIGASGFTFGGSTIALSVPEPIFGVAVVTAYMEVIHVPFPVCLTPPVSTTFRWGQTLTRGDLAICIVDGFGNPLGPVCVSYTLYHIVRGCAQIQIGASGRKPATSSLGCYYVTGTAGECGQPGLWMVRWKYQRTFGAPVVEKECFFQVLDHVLGPVFGDTLQRECKYGWD
jgi:hypothetical protein